VVVRWSGVDALAAAALRRAEVKCKTVPERTRLGGGWGLGVLMDGEAGRAGGLGYKFTMGALLGCVVFFLTGLLKLGKPTLGPALWTKDDGDLWFLSTLRYCGISDFLRHDLFFSNDIGHVFYKNKVHDCVL
jgi:hypothetical protein